MTTWVRLPGWAACLVFALGAHRSGEAANAQAPPHLGSVSRCFCQVSPSDAVEEKECSAARGPSYERWRRHVEIMEFTGVTTTNQTFTRTIRNVSPEDDVYLRARLEHPLRYSFSLTLSQTDAPDRILLNVSGSPMPALGTLIQAAAQGAAAAAVSQAELGEQKARLTDLPPEFQDEAKRRLDGVSPSLSRLEDQLSGIANLLRQAAVVGGEEAAIKDVVAILWPPNGGGPSHDLQKIRDALQPLTSTQAEELKKRVSDLAQKTATLESQIATVRDALDEGDMCLYLGRFEAARRVQVSATLTARPELQMPSAPSDPSSAMLRDAIEKASKTLERGLEEERSGAATRSERGGDTETEATADEPVPTPTPVDRLTTSFDVMKPVHVHTSFGFPVTWLEETTYSLVSVPSSEVANGAAAANGEGTNGEGANGGATNGSATPPETVKLVPQSNLYRVLPTFFVALNLWEQYPFSTEDSDPYESLSRRHRHGLSITVGFPLQDIGRNYMFGAGFYVYPGIQIVGGVHLGRVTRLREDFEENTAFEKPDSNFQVSDATHTPYKWSGYLGVTVDSSTIARIFGGGDQ